MHDNRFLWKDKASTVSTILITYSSQFSTRQFPTAVAISKYRVFTHLVLFILFFSLVLISGSFRCSDKLLQTEAVPVSLTSSNCLTYAPICLHINYNSYPSCHSVFQNNLRLLTKRQYKIIKPCHYYNSIILHLAPHNN